GPQVAGNNGGIAASLSGASAAGRRAVAAYRRSQTTSLLAGAQTQPSESSKSHGLTIALSGEPLERCAPRERPDKETTGQNAAIKKAPRPIWVGSGLRGIGRATVAVLRKLWRE